MESATDVRFESEPERIRNGYDHDPEAAAHDVVDKPISPDLGFVQRRRVGELALR